MYRGVHLGRLFSVQYSDAQYESNLINQESTGAAWAIGPQINRVETCWPPARLIKNNNLPSAACGPSARLIKYQPAI